MRFPEPNKKISTKTDPSCCHYDGEGHEDWAEIAELWNANTNFSEDCLYLNVWRPDGGFNKAVMVSTYTYTYTSGASVV